MYSSVFLQQEILTPLSSCLQYVVEAFIFFQHDPFPELLCLTYTTNKQGCYNVFKVPHLPEHFLDCTVPFFILAYLQDLGFKQVRLY